jgi:hypothetical protein
MVRSRHTDTGVIVTSNEVGQVCEILNENAGRIRVAQEKLLAIALVASLDTDDKTKLRMVRLVEEAADALATPTVSQEGVDALAAELERVTAALRKISEGATGVTGIPDRDRLIGIKQEADRALAGGARAAQEDE